MTSQLTFTVSLLVGSINNNLLGTTCVQQAELHTKQSRICFSSDRFYALLFSSILFRKGVAIIHHKLICHQAALGLRHHLFP